MGIGPFLFVLSIVLLPPLLSVSSVFSASPLSLSPASALSLSTILMCVFSSAICLQRNRFQEQVIYYGRVCLSFNVDFFRSDTRQYTFVCSFCLHNTIPICVFLQCNKFFPCMCLTFNVGFFKSDISTLHLFGSFVSNLCFLWHFLQHNRLL